MDGTLIAKLRRPILASVPKGSWFCLVCTSIKQPQCFCGETEEEHADKLSLVMVVGYDMVYMFAYSMREKKHAHRNNADDVPEEVKQRRLAELIEAFRESTGQCYDSQIGTIQVVLVEGSNKRAPDTELIEKKTIKAIKLHLLISLC